jgi:hypothetical protein
MVQRNEPQFRVLSVAERDAAAAAGAARHDRAAEGYRHLCLANSIANRRCVELLGAPFENLLVRLDDLGWNAREAERALYELGIKLTNQFITTCMAAEDVPPARLSDEAELKLEAALARALESRKRCPKPKGGAKPGKAAGAATRPGAGAAVL